MKRHVEGYEWTVRVDVAHDRARMCDGYWNDYLAGDGF